MCQHHQFIWPVTHSGSQVFWGSQSQEKVRFLIKLGQRDYSSPGTHEPFSRFRAAKFSQCKIGDEFGLVDRERSHSVFYWVGGNMGMGQLVKYCRDSFQLGMKEKASSPFPCSCCHSTLGFALLFSILSGMQSCVYCCHCNSSWI